MAAFRTSSRGESLEQRFRNISFSGTLGMKSEELKFPFLFGRFHLPDKGELQLVVD